jgi:hypothetical protein
VQEDVHWGRVVVRAVQPEISILGLSEEAGDGGVQPGDSLFAIGHDACSSWPMSRLVLVISEQ